MAMYYHCEDKDFDQFVRDQLMFRKVVKVREVDDQTAELTLDNGVVLVAEGNEGCGGCGNGWFLFDRPEHLRQRNHQCGNRGRSLCRSLFYLCVCR